MDWTSEIKEILQRYSGQTGGTASAPADPHQDFQLMAEAAPAKVLASGISQAFRSDQTPPFPEMLSNLFSNSDPNQRAGLLNRLLSSLGPGGITALSDLGGLSVPPSGKITPEQANQISPGQVQQVAAHAERQNPSTVDEVSSFYAEHPQVMKAAGGLALSIALRHILQRH